MLGDNSSSDSNDDDRTDHIEAQSVPPSEQGLAGYLVRHWRGQQSLAWSYWINVLLVSLVYTIIGVSFFYFTYEYGQNAGKFIILSVVGYLFAVVIIYIWQLVGCWRSATNHIRQTGRRFWAIVTMLILILGVLKTARDVGQFSEAYLEIGKISLGIDDISQMEAEVYAADDVMVLSGAINFDTPDRVKDVAISNSAIDFLELDSIGGRGMPAFELADFVADKQWTTYVYGECASACAIVFLAGFERIIHSDAYIGFHQEDLLGVPEDEALSLGLSQSKYYRDRRVPDWFVQRMEATPPDDMWYPNLKELGEAGIITHIYDGVLTMKYDDYCENNSCE